MLFSSIGFHSPTGSLDDFGINSFHGKWILGCAVNFIHTQKSCCEYCRGQFARQLTALTDMSVCLAPASACRLVLSRTRRVRHCAAVSGRFTVHQYVSVPGGLSDTLTNTLYNVLTSAVD